MYIYIWTNPLHRQRYYRQHPFLKLQAQPMQQLVAQHQESTSKTHLDRTQHKSKRLNKKIKTYSQLCLLECKNYYLLYNTILYNHAHRIVCKIGEYNTCKGSYPRIAVQHPVPHTLSKCTTFICTVGQGFVCSTFSSH